MNKQKEREKDISKKKLESYEDNLKIHYEACRKDLDIQLTSSMPQQMNIIKTILWINLLLFGLSIQILKDVKFNFAYDNIVYLIFYIATFISIILMIAALLKRNPKWYGAYENIGYSYELYDEKYAKSDMLGTLLKNARTAFEENRKVMKEIADVLHYALWGTYIAILGFIGIIVIHAKGGDVKMAEEKPKAPQEQPVNITPANESFERSVQKPITTKIDSNSSVKK